MPTRPERRPSPDELLRRVQADELRERRGRLKIVLGYASRVGKSVRMFAEGRRRKQRGQDVVAGALQNDVTPEIRQLLSGVEIIPAITERHAGATYHVIDLNALFRRHPQVCLIDGLAYDNPPGSRNPHRWQDVNELLERGISVIAAINLQYVQEKQDAVQRITGKRAPYSVPEKFLRAADEIEVVDAPPDASVSRAAGDSVGDARKLAELRELALLLAADVVDQQLQEYLDAHGIAARWGAQERILVCITPRSSASAMLRAGHRNAERFHGALLAAYVEQKELNAADRAMLKSHLALAGELGAEIHCLDAPDFVEAILELARDQRVTQVFLGHTLRDHRHVLRTPIERLIDAAEDFDIRLFPHAEAE